ncbi:Type 1 glutamine amidotransferase-like domain-containing protein [Eupransor demetentiae]|uniref:Peptidase E (PepE) n=1 Tax=Eupransor demetentiae TaxID=3109584 RepID=A0ABM9N2V3_9LACO|nr:Peptidase E (PepE) [Lactobacillaceae bacterium LMG 33000]
MKKFFLTSYLAGTAPLLAGFLKKDTNQPQRTLFITTAGNVESYTRYISEGRATLVKLGLQIDELDIAAVDEATAREQIKQAEMITIVGGNTFYLLQELKRKDLLPLLREKCEAGTPYIGESAGSIILAPDISYAQIVDSPDLAPELKDYSGLALTDFYTLPHYIEPPFTEEVQETYRRYHDQQDLVPISNSEAIVVTGDEYKVVK